MRAACVKAPGLLQLIEAPVPSPGPNDAIVAVAFSGICGSDVEIFDGRRPSDYVQYPVIPGHEWSGTIAAVGSSVERRLLGRKVVGEGFHSCRNCAPCARGEAILCEQEYDEIGFTRSGGWATSLIIPAEQLHVLSDDADLRSAAGLEPAACAAEAVYRATVEKGDRVAIVGAGTIGTLTVQLLRAAELSELVVIEPDERAAEMAQRCGATAAIRSPSIKNHDRFDIVIEAAGAASTARTSLDLVRRGGRLVLVGIPDASARLAVAEIVTKRIEIRTVFGASSAAWNVAVEAFSVGILNPGLLVTHEFDLANAQEALELVMSSRGNVGKVLLRP